MAAKSSIFDRDSTKIAVGIGAGLLAGLATFLAIKEKKRRAQNKINVYESQKSLDEYLLMHFGTKEDLMWYRDGPAAALEFPKRCAERCIRLAQDDPALGPHTRVLDLGCAVGRASFELGRYFNDVTGVDFSHSFINAANRLKQEGEMKYEMQAEGDIKTSGLAAVDPKLNRQRCTFVQGDACALDEKLGKFGVVLGANLLCRLPKPKVFLKTISSFIVPGGYLVLPSPYTWLEQFTPKEEWVGGYYDARGVPVTTFDGLKTALLADFELVTAEDEPFVIRETRRKNQWTVSHVTVWKRRAATVAVA